MNMINSLPRFGLEEANGVVRVFDYATSVYHTVENEDTVIESTDGVWNAAAIAEAIRTQQQVFGAFIEERGSSEDDLDETELGRSARSSRRRIQEHDQTEAQRQHRDKVKQARQDFLTDGNEQRTQEGIEQTGAEVAAGAGGQQQEAVQSEEEEARKRSEEEQRRQQEAQAAQDQQQNQGGAPA